MMGVGVDDSKIVIHGATSSSASIGLNDLNCLNDWNDSVVQNVQAVQIVQTVGTRVIGLRLIL
jgi:hypothetical protein